MHEGSLHIVTEWAHRGDHARGLADRTFLYSTPLDSVPRLRAGGTDTLADVSACRGRARASEHVLRPTFLQTFHPTLDVETS